MITNFRKFGEKQFITFDIAYNVVKDVKVEKLQNGVKNHKWGLGLFLGKNNNNRSVCYCMCLVNI